MLEREQEKLSTCPNGGENRCTGLSAPSSLLPETPFDPIRPVNSLQKPS